MPWALKERPNQVQAISLQKATFASKIIVYYSHIPEYNLYSVECTPRTQASIEYC